MRFGLTNFIPQAFTEFPAIVPSLSMAVSKCQPVTPAGVQLWLLLPLSFPPTESSAGWVCLPQGARPKWFPTGGITLWSPGAADDTQPAASSSDPVLGLGFVILKAVVLRAVLAQKNLSFHSKKRPAPYFSTCKCTVTTSEVTVCYWLEAQSRACQILLSRPGTEGRSPQPLLSILQIPSLNTSPNHRGLTICPCRGSRDLPTPSVWTQEHLPRAPGSVSGMEIMKATLLMKNQREWLNPSLGFFFPLKPSQNDIALPASVCTTTPVANQCHELASGKRNMWKIKTRILNKRDCPVPPWILPLPIQMWQRWRKGGLGISEWFIRVT